MLVCGGGWDGGGGWQAVGGTVAVCGASSCGGGSCEGGRFLLNFLLNSLSKLVPIGDNSPDKCGHGNPSIFFWERAPAGSARSTRAVAIWHMSLANP